MFGGLFFIYAGLGSLGAFLGIILLLPHSFALVVAFWLTMYAMFALYMTALWPFLLSRVFPSQLTLSRDVGIWNALGGPMLVLAASSQSSLLASAGTTWRRMSGGREQYELAGYQSCLTAAIFIFFTVPVIMHAAGTYSKSLPSAALKSTTLL